MYYGNKIKKGKNRDFLFSLNSVNYIYIICTNIK